MREGLNFSGAPALLLPGMFAHAWRGFYLPWEGAGTPDLELESGNWRLDDTFDFQNPRTDYDRLCAALGDGPMLVPVGAGHAVAFGPGSDYFSWWAEENTLVANGDPGNQRLDALTFETVSEWDVPDGPLALMSSCMHGLETFSPTEGRIVSLAAGRYTVAWAYSEETCAWYCRFTRNR